MTSLIKKQSSLYQAILLLVFLLGFTFFVQADTIIEPIRTFEIDGPFGAQSVVFSPDGQKILSGGRGHATRLWDVSTGQLIHTFGEGEGERFFVNSVAFSPDGQAALSGDDFKGLNLWDIKTGELIRTFIGHSGPINSVAYSPDGQTILSSGNYWNNEKQKYEVEMYLWKVNTGELIHAFVGHTRYILSLSYSPDGQMVLSGGGYKDDNDNYIGEMFLWNISTGKLIRSFENHTGLISSIAYSPDGKMVLSDNGDKISLWEVSTGKLIRSFNGHSHPITSVTFSPNKQMILSGGGYCDLLTNSICMGEMFLWSLSTGEIIHSFVGLSSTIESVAFSPDGLTALSSERRTIKLWDLGLASNKAPIANFTASPSSGDAPLTVNLDANQSSDSDGNIVSYQWTTSTGQTASGQTASLTFTAVGLKLKK